MVFGSRSNMERRTITFCLFGVGAGGFKCLNAGDRIIMICFGMLVQGYVVY